MRTDRDISKLLTDSNSAKLRLSVVKNTKNYFEGLYRTVKKTENIKIKFFNSALFQKTNICSFIGTSWGMFVQCTCFEKNRRQKISLADNGKHL